MLKTILVVLEDQASAVIPYSVSAARKLGARVTAIRPRRDVSGLEDGSLAARLEVVSGAAEAHKARARETLEAFAAAAEGLDLELLTPDEGQDPSRDIVGIFARCFDLTIVQQTEPGRAPASDDLVGELLKESGRPVLVVPAIQHDPAVFKRVVVAWDGSAAAARAFGDAMMILEQAQQVEIVSVAGPQTSPVVAQGGERLAARLQRGGVPAVFRRLPTPDDPANVLLSYVADVGADLMVAGGYGHSRLVEAIFGGATRTFLTSMTLPLFLSR